MTQDLNAKVRIKADEESFASIRSLRAEIKQLDKLVSQVSKLKINAPSKIKLQVDAVDLKRQVENATKPINTTRRRQEQMSRWRLENKDCLSLLRLRWRRAANSWLQEDHIDVSMYLCTQISRQSFTALSRLPRLESHHDHVQESKDTAELRKNSEISSLPGVQKKKLRL